MPPFATVIYNYLPIKLILWIDQFLFNNIHIFNTPAYQLQQSQTLLDKQILFSPAQKIHIPQQHSS